MCNVCEDNNKFNIMNGISNEYSGVEIALNATIKILRVRVDSDPAQDMISVAYCPVCGREL